VRGETITLDPAMKLSEYRIRFQNPRSAGKYATRFDAGARKRISSRETRAAGRIIGSLPNCDSIVDIPCGAGRFVPVLTESARQVLCCDVSRQLLELAEERYRGLATFACGDATAIPLADASVDCVFCNRLLHHFSESEDRLRVMRELRRVTRRWAVISFFDYHRGKVIRRVLRWLKGARKKAGERPTCEQFAAELEASGFVIERHERAGPVWTSESYFVARAR
jgi:ubiquinone/menaquinone biosynthesis C-methylase UbiE